MFNCRRNHMEIRVYYKMSEYGADNIWPLMWALKDAWKVDIICIGKEEGRRRTRCGNGKALDIMNKLVFSFTQRKNGKSKISKAFKITLFIFLPSSLLSQRFH